MQASKQGQPMKVYRAIECLVSFFSPERNLTWSQSILNRPIDYEAREKDNYEWGPTFGQLWEETTEETCKIVWMYWDKNTDRIAVICRVGDPRDPSGLRDLINDAAYPAWTWTEGVTTFDLSDIFKIAEFIDEYLFPNAEEKVA